MSAPVIHAGGNSGDLDPDRLAVLAQAARALHGERDPERAISWTRGAIARLTGLAETAVCLLPRHGSPTWSYSEGGIPFDLLGDPRAQAVLRDAIDTGAAIVLDDLAAAEASLPADDRISRRCGIGALIVVPVMAKDGLAQAALVVAATSNRAVDRTHVEALTALAAHVGVALDNAATLARMAEVEARGKEVVHALQEAVRPPAPVVPHTELGVHYVAADPSAPTGGDLYDWITLPDGDLHVVVVDVMGKGVEATKHALSVTHALRLLALEGCALGDLVARADVLVTAQNPELVATLVIARYTPTTGRTLLAGAGHPPALVVSGEEVREVAAPGIPIGWPGAGSDGIVELELGRSDTLILYTDGLIEATKDIVQGLEDLGRAAAATSTYPANALARALVERQLAGAMRQDDSVALVLRRRAPSTGRRAHLLSPFHHRFSPQPAAVPLARHLLRDWLQFVPVEAAAMDSLLLAASELFSNAVRHSTGAPGSVEVTAWTEDDSVLLEVSDDGGALTVLDQHDEDLPDPEAERGRGLFLVAQLADSMAVRLDEGRSIVRLEKHAVVGASPSSGSDAPPR